MVNSSLVSYKKISPNRTSPRNSTIDTISIHCYVGQVSVEKMGEEFSLSGKAASCNYGIGADGRVGMYVEEKDRSWCTSDRSNDNRAVTIEVACDTVHPYRVNDRVVDSLITLVADICQRNGIKELKWKGDRSLIGQIDKQNMTVHRWFANKACPGEYLYGLHGEIANRVNCIIGENAELVEKTVVLVNGQEVELNRILKDGKNYVELRAFGEMLGYNVGYDAEKKLVSLNK